MNKKQLLNRIQRATYRVALICDQTPYIPTPPHTIDEAFDLLEAAIASALDLHRYARVHHQTD